MPAALPNNLSDQVRIRRSRGGRRQPRPSVAADRSWGSAMVRSRPAPSVCALPTQRTLVAAMQSQSSDPTLRRGRGRARRRRRRGGGRWTGGQRAASRRRAHTAQRRSSAWRAARGRPQQRCGSRGRSSRCGRWWRCRGRAWCRQARCARPTIPRCCRRWMCTPRPTTPCERRWRRRGPRARRALGAARLCAALSSTWAAHSIRARRHRPAWPRLAAQPCATTATFSTTRRGQRRVWCRRRGRRRTKGAAALRRRRRGATPSS